MQTPAHHRPSPATERHRLGAAKSMVGWLAAVGLFGSACGSIDDALVSAGAETTLTTQQEAAVTSAPAAEASTTLPPTTEAATAEPATTEPSTTEPPAENALPAGAVDFFDPDGAFVMSVNPAWGPAGDVAANVDAWLVQVNDSGFDSNLTVIVDPAVAPDLETVLDQAVEDASLGDYEVVSSSIFVGATGNNLGEVRLASVVDGESITFDQIIGLWDGIVVTVTLASSDPAAFETNAVYMRTLHQP